MKWLWTNTTKVYFGEYAVRDHIEALIKPGMRVICTYGGGSIERNSCKSDVIEQLDRLNCTYEWHGGIPPNPEFDRLVEIVAEVRRFKPDVILAVGGGSVVDGSKFISLAACASPNEDLWEMVLNQSWPKKSIPLGTVMTIPATGSEWNQGFVISRRSLKLKMTNRSELTFPVCSFLDPRYTLTLPLRQIRNGLFDAFTHLMEQYCTGEVNPMTDDFMIAAMKEIVTIAPEITKEGASIEYYERLMMAALFGLNRLFGIAKDQCWETHIMGYPLTTLYGMDHACTLGVLLPAVLKRDIKEREFNLAKLATDVFGVTEGTQEQKAREAIAKIESFRDSLGLKGRISDYGEPDLDELHKLITITVKGGHFGYHMKFNPDVAREIYESVL